MKNQQLNQEHVKRAIYEAVRWLVKAAHATERKTGERVGELSSDFKVGDEAWRLTISRIEPAATERANDET